MRPLISSLPGKVFRAQLDLLRGEAPRRNAVRLAILLAVMALTSALDAFPGWIDTESGTAWTWVDAHLMDIPEGTVSLLLALPWLLLAALVGSIRAWKGEAPSERGYHWAMPIDRRLHDLLRIAAGAAWLELVILTFVATGATIALVTGRGAGIASISPAGWSTFFLAPLVFYLLGSALGSCTERPGRWLFGFLFASLALLRLTTHLGVSLFAPLADTLVSGPWGLNRAAGATFFAELFRQGQTSLGATLLWLAFGLLAVAAAVTRRPAS